MGAAEELARLVAEGDRVTAALLAMDDHPGHRLLRAHRLTGGTRARWERTSTSMALLWEWFDVYRSVLSRARDAEPDALARLLDEPVELDPRPVTVRTLTGPSTRVERITLAELVDRMRERYAEVTAVLTGAHDAWSARLAVLDPLGATLAALPDSPPVLRLREEVARAHARAVGDPLTPDPEVAELADRVAELAVLDRDLGGRVEAMRARITEVTALRERARVLRPEVVARIAGEHPPVPDDDPGRALEELRARYPDVREVDVARVESAVDAAWERAGALVSRLEGSLARRAELRGRLEAYRAKASRTGFAEDAGLAELYRAAQRVLYDAPCDLAEGTRTVNRYQRGVLDRTEAGR
ncbi:hypothetical protein [Actinosynnema sp. NPDC020468]|uniref:hypothetical protein n=1 Tax=Actinosynnema sp. NPDC020468 TaxID=3154488 RepID=UPI0033C6CE6D